MSAVAFGKSSDAFAAFAKGFGAYTLVGGLIGLALYGVLCVLFCATLYVIYIRRPTSGFNYLLFSASIFIFVFSSVDTVLRSHRLMIGLLYTPLPFTPDEYFLASYDWISVLDEGVIVLDMLTADAVLLYRVWIVWGKRWQFVSVNVLLWLTFLASSIRTLQVQVTIMQNPADVLLLFSLERWSLITQSLSLVQTLTATALLAIRIWRIHRASSPYTRQGNLLPVIRIVVESGGIYALLMLVYVPSMTTGLPLDMLLMQLVTPTIGIAFSLIIVRVGLNLTGETRATTGARGDNSHPSQPVTISIRRDVEIETGGPGDGVCGFDEEKGAFVLGRRESVFRQTV